MNKNIFILGDLMIDHTVFVTDPTSTHQRAAGETIFEVIRRQNNAGGAANSARVLALLNSGTTYLWGILGQTRWGHFRDILEDSLTYDGAPKNVELRGVVDESGASMNTITRLVEMTNDRYIRKIRYDDTGHIHITDEKRHSVLFHMERINNKTPLDAIIINDLDKGAINKSLMENINQFALSEEIPIFVDPKRERKKYDQIQGTAILPNLEEWCCLVEKRSELSKYYMGLDNRAILSEMAQLSFRYLGNFKYHIITCDKEGSLLMIPDPNSRNGYCVFHAPAVYNTATVVDSPLGAGDILTAVFAANYEKSRSRKDDFNMFMEAFQSAHDAAGAYCGKPWHLMPSEKDIKFMPKQVTWMNKPKIAINGALRFLPKEATIDLRPHRTAVPKIYSISKKLRDELNRLVKDLKEDNHHHFLIGAPSGFGKSVIIDGIKKLFVDKHVSVIKGKKLAAFASGDHNQ